MEPLKSKDKRAGIRIPLLAEKVSFTIEGSEQLADVADITNEGMFLKTPTLAKPLTNIVLKLNLPGDLGTLQVSGQVVRVNWTLNRRLGREHLGMGVRFENVSPNIKKILDAYVVYLRNKQIITVSRRIIEEFFGNDTPKKLI